jgi:hypothetical protein
LSVRPVSLRVELPLELRPASRNGGPGVLVGVVVVVDRLELGGAAGVAEFRG